MAAVHTSHTGDIEAAVDVPGIPPSIASSSNRSESTPMQKHEGTPRRKTTWLTIGLVVFFGLVSMQPILTEMSKGSSAAIPYIASSVILIEALVSCTLGCAINFRSVRQITPRLLLRYMPVGVLRAVEDSLSIISLNYMDPSLYSVIVQSRLILTAFASAFVLRKNVRTVEWMGVAVISVSLVEYSIDKLGADREVIQPPELRHSNNQVLLGILLTCIAVVFKVAASIYLEKVVQEDQHLSISLQSAIISASTIFMSAVWVGVDASRGGHGGNIFSGWDLVVAILLVTILCKNWLSNLVVKEFSSIVKYVTYALAVASIYVLQLVIFGGRPTAGQIADSILIVLGVYIFADGKHLERTEESMFGKIGKLFRKETK
jgi:drug/metabolite transporter (DMT)-like permease